MFMTNLNRSALTVIEVLFAMGIVLVGLVGIAAMVPFAARQANDSYAIVQSISAGDSAAAMAEAQSLFKPTVEKKWQIIDDESTTFGDSEKTYFSSFKELYNNNGRNGNPATNSPKYRYDLLTKQLDDLNFASMGTVLAQEQVAWIAVNRTLGATFYLDPAFWGAQEVSNTKVLESSAAWTPFRRSRFPYYRDSYGPSSPRALRISIHDTNHTYQNGGWMKPSSARTTVSPSSDLVSIKPTRESGIYAQREFYIDNSNNPLASVSSPTAPIWSALIAPTESTPILEKSRLPSKAVYNTPALYAAAMRNFVFPAVVEAYDLSIVVQKRRLLPELYVGAGAAPGTVEGERLFLATWDTASDLPSATGSFDITLTQPSSVTDTMEAKFNAGDWLMLSRNVVHFYKNSSGDPDFIVARQKHKWYRVVSAPNSRTFPLTVRVSGGAWTWTTDELKSAAAAGVSLVNVSVGDLTRSFSQQTSATVVPNVVHVFERTMSVSN